MCFTPSLKIVHQRWFTRYSIVSGVCQYNKAVRIKQPLDIERSKVGGHNRVTLNTSKRLSMRIVRPLDIVRPKFLRTIIPPYLYSPQLTTINTTAACSYYLLYVGTTSSVQV